MGLGGRLARVLREAGNGSGFYEIRLLQCQYEWKLKADFGCSGDSTFRRLERDGPTEPKASFSQGAARVPSRIDSMKMTGIHNPGNVVLLDKGNRLRTVSPLKALLHPQQGRRAYQKLVAITQAASRVSLLLSKDPPTPTHLGFCVTAGKWDGVLELVSATMAMNGKEGRQFLKLLIREGIVLPRLKGVNKGEVSVAIGRSRTSPPPGRPSAVPQEGRASARSLPGGIAQVHQERHAGGQSIPGEIAPVIQEPAEAPSPARNPPFDALHSSGAAESAQGREMLVTFADLLALIQDCVWLEVGPAIRQILGSERDAEYARIASFKDECDVALREDGQRPVCRVQTSTPIPRRDVAPTDSSPRSNVIDFPRMGRAGSDEDSAFVSVSSSSSSSIPSPSLPPFNNAPKRSNSKPVTTVGEMPEESPKLALPPFVLASLHSKLPLVKEMQPVMSQLKGVLALRGKVE